MRSFLYQCWGALEDAYMQAFGISFLNEEVGTGEPITFCITVTDKAVEELEDIDEPLLKRLTDELCEEFFDRHHKEIFEYIDWTSEDDSYATRLSYILNLTDVDSDTVFDFITNGPHCCREERREIASAVVKHIAGEILREIRECLEQFQTTSLECQAMDYAARELCTAVKEKSDRIEELVDTLTAVLYPWLGLTPEGIFKEHLLKYSKGYADDGDAELACLELQEKLRERYKKLS